MRRSHILLMILCGGVFFVELAASVPIFVNVAGDVDGTLTYINTSFLNHTSVLEVLSVWENTGSAGCKTYMRVDVEDENGSVIYTSWSNVERVAPGGIATFKNYWFFGNLSGNFTLVPKLYFCDEIKEFEKIRIILNKSLHDNFTIEYIPSSSWIPADDPSTINVEIIIPNSSTKVLKDVLVLPLTIPPGDKVFAAYFKELEPDNGVIKLQLGWDYGVLTAKKIPMVLIEGSSGEIYRFDVTTEIRERNKLPLLQISFIGGVVLGIACGLVASRHIGSREKGASKNKTRGKES